MFNLGVTLDCQGRFEEAERYLLGTRELVEKALGKQHRLIPTILFHAAGAVLSQGRGEEAQLIIQRSIRSVEETYGKESGQMLDSMHALARIFVQKEVGCELEVVCRKGLELSTKLLGEKHCDTIWWMQQLGLGLARQQKHNEATRVYRQALPLMEQVTGIRYGNMVKLREDMEKCLEEMERETSRGENSSQTG